MLSAINTNRLHFEQSPLSCGTKYILKNGNEPLPYLEAIDLLAQNPEFRERLTAVLAASEYTAYRWETPPVTLAKSARPFEFVLVNSPHLAPIPESGVFRSYFSALSVETDVLAVPNLGNTATLVIPRQLSEPEDYAHLARFVRGAPKAQIHHLWQCVAKTVKANLSERPLWLSTAGGGVSWLHVRIEAVPKYYSYRPYADGADHSD